MQQKITVKDVQDYVSKHIGGFHKARLDSLSKLRLDKVLGRKNPYLFKAKNIVVASDLVKGLLDAHISSQEETLFGNFLEGVAIFVNENVYGGWKSTTEGIDLEFVKDKVRYIVSIKSGPNWGNSSQIQKMKQNFTKAKQLLRQNDKLIDVRAINGCCYGRDGNTDKGEYEKYCGQKFWTFISGNDSLYKEIIQPLGHRAKQRNEAYMKQYASIVNSFTLLFSERFCKGGEIQWQDLVEFNSAEAKPSKISQKKP